MSVRRIIIDTDPGQDDAVAMLTALASPELDVVAVTTVAGNVPLERTTANALAMVELAGRPEVPVHAGCRRPMVRPLVTAEYVHGPTGIDGADLPDPTLTVTPGHAVDVIVDLLTGTEQTTVCLLGPHTNLAMAMVKQPAIVGHIDEIVLMGGGFFEGGNTTPAAEFNIYVDPHAAHVVFTSGVPITMMPLDVTHRALTTDARIARFQALGTRAGDAVARDARLLRPSRRGQVRHRRRPAPRPVRHRLPAPARAVHRQAVPCRRGAPLPRRRWE